MNEKAIDQARQKLSAFVEHFLPRDLARAFRFIALARGEDGGWGRVRGNISEIRTTVLALTAMARDVSHLQYGEFDDGIQYLRNSLSKSGTGKPPEDNSTGAEVTLEEFAMAGLLLSALDQDKYRSLIGDIRESLIGSQNEDGGWGERTSMVATTAIVLVALTRSMSSRLPADTVRKGATYLEASVNGDGGWGASKGSPSTALHTSWASLARTLIGKDGVSSQALSYLLSMQNKSEGTWGQDDQSDVVYVTALVSQTLGHCGVDKGSPTIKDAVQYLRNHQNDDGGWGWTVDGISEVEPTATVINALWDLGSTEYIPVLTAAEVLKGTFEENAALREENKTLGDQIDAQVQFRIRNIIDTKDRLESRVTVLEKQLAGSSRLELENQRLRDQIQELTQLRVAQAHITRLLEEAIAVAVGRSSGSPNRIVDGLEDIIARTPVIADDPALCRTISEALLDATHVSLENKERFIRGLRSRFAREMPKSIADEIISYIAALPNPASLEETKQIAQLATRIERGRVRSFAEPSAGSLSPIWRLESAVQSLSLYDHVLAGRIVDMVTNMMPQLSTDDIDRFPEFLSERYLASSDVPIATQRAVLQAIRDVLVWKQSVPESLFSDQMRVLRSGMTRKNES